MCEQEEQDHAGRRVLTYLLACERPASVARAVGRARCLRETQGFPSLTPESAENMGVVPRTDGGSGGSGARQRSRYGAYRSGGGGLPRRRRLDRAALGAAGGPEQDAFELKTLLAQRGIASRGRPLAWMWTRGRGDGAEPMATEAPAAAKEEEDDDDEEELTPAPAPKPAPPPRAPCRRRAALRSRRRPVSTKAPDADGTRSRWWPRAREIAI